MATREDVVQVLVDDYEIDPQLAEKVLDKAEQVGWLFLGHADEVAEEIYSEQELWEVDN